MEVEDATVVDGGEEVDVGGDGGSGDEAVVVVGGGGAQGSRDRVKGPWSPEEDAVLSRLVSKFGARNWSLIARGIAGRSGKSCRLRWCNQLDPAVKRKPFTGAVHIAWSKPFYVLLSFFISVSYFDWFRMWLCFFIDYLIFRLW
jgi:hypothetical protein